MREFWPIDHNLVQTFNRYSKTMVIADMGLATRLSMVYWATHDEGGRWIDPPPVVLCGKVMHRYLRDEMDRTMKVNGAAPPIYLDHPQALLYRKPPDAKRVVIETNIWGHNVHRYVRDLAASPSHVALRVLKNGLDKTFFDYIVGLGFTIIAYRLNADVKNELTPTIMVL